MKQNAMSTSMSTSSTLDGVNEAAAGVCAEVIPGVVWQWTYIVRCIPPRTDFAVLLYGTSR